MNSLGSEKLKKELEAVWDAAPIVDFFEQYLDKKESIPIKLLSNEEKILKIEAEADELAKGYTEIKKIGQTLTQTIKILDDFQNNLNIVTNSLNKLFNREE